MKRYFISIFILLIITINCTRSGKITDNELQKIDTALDSANSDLLPNSVKKKITERVLQNIQKWDNDSTKVIYLFKIANRYYNSESYNDYYSVTRDILDISSDRKDTANVCKAFFYMSDYFLLINKSDSAFYYTNRGVKAAKSANLSSFYTQGLLNKATIFINENDYTSAERELFRVLKVLKSNPDNQLLATTYGMMGLIFYNLKEYDQAEIYYRKLITIGEASNLEQHKFLSSTALNNIGSINLEKENFKTSLFSFYEALKIDSLYEKRLDIFLTINDNLEYTKYKLGQKNNYLKNGQKLARLKDSISDFRGYITSQLRLSDVNFSFKNNKDAIKNAFLAYEKANEIKDEFEKSFALKQLIKVDRSNASKYAEEYIRISDSLQIAERRIRNKLARIEYETDELIVEKNSLIEQRKSIIYITLALLTIGAFVFIIRIQMAKNRELILIQQQQKANEEIYELMLTQQSKMEAVRQTEKRNIARELHDGVLGKLFGTRLNLGLLNEKNTEKAAEERIQFIEELKKIEQEIREISHDLSQEKAALVNNFVLVLRDYFEKQQQITSTNIILDIADDIQWQEIDNVTKINLYRIMQECLQNINKHAQASEAQFTITQADTDLNLQVVDNGIGFNATKEKKGIGLKNIDLRVKQTKAIMEISSEKNKGTSFLFKFPLTSYS